MPDVVMTNHSVKRTKERIGLSKKIADKNAQRALEYGVTHSEAKGGLCRYLDKLYLSNGNANNVAIVRSLSSIVVTTTPDQSDKVPIVQIIDSE